jgi:hypothetical protein
MNIELFFFFLKRDVSQVWDAVLNLFFWVRFNEHKFKTINYYVGTLLIPIFDINVRLYKSPVLSTMTNKA